MKGQKGRVLISSIFAVLLCPGVPGGGSGGGGTSCTWPIREGSFQKRYLS